MQDFITDKDSSVDTKSLLLEYYNTKDAQLRNKLVMHYGYIAKACAIQLRGVFQNYAQIDDIINHGIITIIECVENYNPEKSFNFESYVYLRVKGSIISLVRQQDWVPRRVRMTAKKIKEAHSELSNLLMREPTNQELAEHLDISVEALEKSLYETSTATMISFEGLIQNVNQMGDLLEDFTDDSSRADGNIYKRELKQKLAESIQNLNERERLVITLFYYEKLKLVDIAKVLDISVQRVSQISSKAVMKMRKYLEDYIKG